MKKQIKSLLDTTLHRPILGIREALKYIGPGLLVTVGFIDPGNWASNIAAGSDYGYQLLWMVTLSTIMLILLQHNVAHLGIVTGDCLSEAASKHLNPLLSKAVLSTAVIASIATAMAEILGGAIALQLLFAIPLKLGAVLVLALVLWMLYSNSYGRLEKWIIGFVSVIGVSFLYELSMVHVDWGTVAQSWVTPAFPEGAMPIIMAVLGAVVMPHNLFLHSEVIQSRQWNKEDPEIIDKQLKYEFTDTLLSMVIGWAINSAMIILAASTFFLHQVSVTEIGQAQQLLEPLLGKGSALVFGMALLFAGISSTTTAGMAGGSIVAGMFREPYDIKDPHTKMGVGGILGLATLLIFLIADPFKGLVYSQMFLSIQLPITVMLQIYLTSSERVMGKYKNSLIHKGLLWTIASIVSLLNIMLLLSFL
ncbi:divalent metal cation transporter [Heliobacterium gestii]|uniref:Divalent metal cation transporter n=1 Tax=Heliomicrobium gestii TaxID=2699 RepID=A0A845LFM2_HELGE|nr:Nramp family divalent metal transporter [Heliomicrobium gestii]MBM7867185.1 manganese transport protein [Heliomicrobium gestii]MZP43740.1 divalent metal cation transporter [Heliomicrobium gestii]